jgi:DNA-binding transcriptional MerR regulator
MINISIVMVEEAWEEWDKGLISGPDGMRSPSIQYLEEKFGAKWRKTDASRKRYTRRKALIQRITRAAKNLRLSESDIAHRIDLWRGVRKMTLDKIQKMLQSCKDVSESWGLNDTQLCHIY